MIPHTKTILYWICQLVGWGAQIAIMGYWSHQYFSEDPLLWKYMALNYAVGLSSLGVSHSMRLYFKRHCYHDLGLRRLIPKVILVSVTGSVTVQMIVHTFIIFVLDWHHSVKPIVWGEIPVYLFNTFGMLGIWSVFYFGFQFFDKARTSRIEELETKSALKDAELIALKAQINPHFLFNSLNNIRALILEDQDKARNMITHLSELLRYSIEFNKQHQVTVEEEIHTVKNYLLLESIHYEDRLSYVFDIDQNSSSCILPPMIVQTLTENAIKHGISQNKNKGEIKVSSVLQDNGLKIQVSNTGRIDSTSERQGVGIRNLKQRCKILYNEEVSFTLAEEGHLVIASLFLPIKK